MLGRERDWKIKGDPFYGPLYAAEGFSAIERAGFFFDSSDIPISVEGSLSYLCTPTSHVRGNVKQARKPVVLLSTGALCPAHEGHVQMMMAAKDTMEREGFDVLGGYLSPGHEEYVRGKTKAQYIETHERLAIIEKLIHEMGQENWLAVDPWEAMGVNVAVNFTIVVLRLEAYLRHHVDPRIEVVYVCGGDNARFCEAFRFRGRACIVSRPPHTEFLRWKESNNNPRIHWAYLDNPISSSQLRNHGSSTKNRITKVYLRREYVDPREEAIANALRKRFEVYEVSIPHQRNLVPWKGSNATYVSLDGMLPARHNLSMSRIYDIGGYRKLGYDARPGSPPLEDQIKKLPQSFYLFDDDIHTGGTMRFAQDWVSRYGIRR